MTDLAALRIVRLAAAAGSRLGRPMPNSLTDLRHGRSILRRQADMCSSRLPEAPISVVVGFKKDLIMEGLPAVSFTCNEPFGEMNTSTSLLRELAPTGTESVLWLNGCGVVSEPTLLGPLVPCIDADRSFVAVNPAYTGDGEVKYDLDERGLIRNLSNQVENGLGEADVGNDVTANDKEVLMTQLDACSDDDYFERGIELVIEHGSSTFEPVDVQGSRCIEVDPDRADQAISAAEGTA